MAADKEEEPRNIAAELDRQLQRMEPETESQSQLVSPSSSPDPSLAEDRRSSVEERCGPVSNVPPPITPQSSALSRQLLVPPSTMVYGIAAPQIEGPSFPDFTKEDRAQYT